MSNPSEHKRIKFIFEPLGEAEYDQDMINANVITCATSNPSSTFQIFFPESASTLTCSIPGTSQAEFLVQLWVAIGTVGAVVASVVLAIAASLREKNHQKKQRELDSYENLTQVLNDLPIDTFEGENTAHRAVRRMMVALNVWRVAAGKKNSDFVNGAFEYAVDLTQIALKLAEYEAIGVRSNGAKLSENQIEKLTSVGDWYGNKKETVRRDFLVSTYDLLDVLNRYYVDQKAVKKLKSNVEELHQKTRITFEAILKFQESLKNVS